MMHDANAAMRTFRPTVIEKSEGEISNPWRGGFVQDGVMNPGDWQTTDAYARVDWRQLETSEGVYDWDAFDDAKARAEATNGKWGFRVMAANSLLQNVPSVPDYLVDDMPNGFWFTYPGNTFQTYAPDWNDSDLMSRYQALLNAIEDRYGDEPSFGWVEPGLFGDFGEWHTWQFPYDGTDYEPSPNGLAADMTRENLEATIDMHVDTFPNQRIIMPLDERDLIPYWTTKYIYMGFRRDCLGSQNYFNGEWEEHYDLVKDRWRNAPFINETCHATTGSGYFERMQHQVRDFHVAMIAGSNMQDYEELTSEEKALLENAYKNSGYRFAIEEIEADNWAAPGESIAINSKWLNDGVTPAYSSWNVRYLLKDSNGVVQASRPSTVSLTNLLPNYGEAEEFVDNFNVPGDMSEGTYTLAIRITDPEGYYEPLRLANEGRQPDGSYNLGEITIDGDPDPSENILTNGSFEAAQPDWLDPWTLYFEDEELGATIEQDDTEFTDGTHSAHYTLTSGSSNPWQIKLIHSSLVLSADQEYRISFDAKATEQVHIYPQLQQNSDPWEELWSTGTEMEPDWTEFSYTFTPENDENNVAFSFMLNNETPFELWLDNVEIVPVTEPETPPPASEPLPSLDTDILNGSFDAIAEVSAEKDWFEPWSLYVQEGYGLSAVVSQDKSTFTHGKWSLQTDVGSGTNAPWRIKLLQGEVDIVPNQTYTVSFDAKATRDTTIYPQIQQTVAPSEVIWETGSPIYAHTWERYSYTFTSENAETDTNFGFMINNAQPYSLWLDNVRVTHAPAPDPEPEPEPEPEPDPDPTPDSNPDPSTPPASNSSPVSPARPNTNRSNTFSPADPEQTEETEEEQENEKPADDAPFITFNFLKDGDQYVGQDGVNGYSTTNRRPVFGGTATAGSVITVEIHSDPITLTATADESGDWSVRPNTDLPIGRHTVYLSMAVNGERSSGDSFTVTILDSEQEVEDGSNLLVKAAVFGFGVLLIGIVALLIKRLFFANRSQTLR